MTLITFSNGNVVMRDGKVGTEQDCCCEFGTCCVCGEHGTGRNSQTEDAAIETTQEELEDVWNLAGWLEDANDIADWLADNGYECVEVYAGSIVISDLATWGEVFKSYQVFFPSVTAKCCGAIDCSEPYYRAPTGTYQADEPRTWPDVHGDYDPNKPFGYTRICPCVPDDTTRTCVENQTEQQCLANCGNVFFHPNSQCADDPCSNPLP